MSKNNVTCSFCGYSGDGRTMFQSNGESCICEECLETAYEVLLEEKAKQDTEMEDAQESAGSNADIMTPDEIKKYLDQYVIGQEVAKKILSVATYNHMKMLEFYDNDSEIEIEKSNVLMLGPSGSGKTHLIKSLARLFKVPYAIADATTLTESGYVGADVESVLQKLLRAADGDVRLAERGIVFIDEIDKKASKGQENNSITRDVSGEGVQQALLKLIEGNKVDVQMNGERRHPYAETVEMDTSKILFIVGGAFPGIQNIIKKRLNYKSAASVGLNLTGKEEQLQADVEYNEVIEQANHEDLRKYGLIPEFLGRLPIICPLKELTEEEMCQILTEPKNSLVKQYTKLMDYDKVDIRFDDEAVKAIARQAISNKTGARGLRSIMEKILLNVMYSTPGEARRNKRSSMVVTRDCVEKSAEPVLVANNIF